MKVYNTAGIILLLALHVFFFCSCRTQKQLTNNTTETKSSEKSIVKEQNSVSETSEKKPAVTNQLQITPELDDSGNFKPTKLMAVSGNDSLIVELKGKLITAKSNCSEQINYLKHEIQIRDSLLTQQHDSTTVKDKYIEVIKEVEVTPWYMQWLIGALILLIIIMACYIIYLRFFK